MEKRKLIAAVDAGTSGTRCCIVDGSGAVLSKGYVPMPTVYARPGYAEQDPETIIEGTLRAVREVFSAGGVDPKDVACVTVTTQRNSFVPVDREGRFLMNMIIWQDQRGEEAHPWILERLQAAGMDQKDFYRKNGQPFASFQCGFKALWLRHFREDVYEKTWKFVTPQAFLTKAFGAETFLEEDSNQSFWLFADADTKKIDPELCRVFDFDPDKFPEAVRAGTLAGSVSEDAARRTGLLQGTPVYVGSGDQQCGAIGAGNYGTTDIVSLCMGTAGLAIAYSPDPVRHPSGMCQIQGHPAGGYLMEAHSSSCTSSSRWAEDLFFPWAREGRAETHPLAAAAERSPAGANGVFFLPWLQGAACPHYNDAARGAYIGMSLANGAGDMCRATLEGICYENRMMLETLREADIPAARVLRVVGGASNNDFWNRIQADIYGIPVETVRSEEATSVGAAVIGAVSAGIYGSYREAVEHMVHVKDRYLPDPERVRQYEGLYEIWNSCYEDLSRGSFDRIYRLQKQ